MCPWFKSRFGHHLLYKLATLFNLVIVYQPIFLDYLHLLRFCGEEIVLQCDGNGKAHGLHNHCPHRGVRLSKGKQWRPNTISCPYHGWTFDLETGDLVAVITNGPDSRIYGKAAVKTYPVEECIGLIWAYIGDGEPHLP